MDLLPSTILACMEKPPTHERYFSKKLKEVSDMARCTQQFLEVSNEVLGLVNVAARAFQEDHLIGKEPLDVGNALNDLTKSYLDAMAIINPGELGMMWYMSDPLGAVGIIFGPKGLMMIGLSPEDGLLVTGLVAIEVDEAWRYLKTDGSTFVMDLVAPSSEEITETMKMVVTFMISIILIAERFVDVEEAHISRPERRRLARLGANPRRWVTANLTRRASAKKPGDVSSVDWSHRWMVRPHWRNQWYPSQGGHKMKYIHPYIKGPEDKELIIKPMFFK